MDDADESSGGTLSNIDIIECGLRKEKHKPPKILRETTWNVNDERSDLLPL